MSSNDDAGTTAPAAISGTAGPANPLLDPVPDDRPRVGARYIWFNVLAQFGVYLAFITPISISLAIRVDAVAPGNEAVLGYLLGAGSIAALITAPVAGVLSDRTRSRFGRRRPWIVGLSVVGVIGLAIMVVASTVFVLGVGWVVTQIGWGSALANLQTSQADRLPESQRGKVAGLSGFVSMAAPVIGSVIGGTVATDPLLLLMIPAVLAVLLIVPFVLLVREEDSRGRGFDDTLTPAALLSKYVYNPRRHPDFSWNWAGRFLFYFGLTLNTAFTAFFYASRLDIPVTEIGGTVAIVGLLSVVATIAGAIGSGFLTDKLRRRKPFVLGAGVVFGIGALVMAFAPSLPLLFTGSFICSLGIGVFSAVDQALLLDVLPERDTDAGRFVGINTFAQTVPQAVAPLIAPALLAIGGAGENYTVLYVVAALFTIAGGVVVLRIRSVR
ncbi:MFS transporter [Amycolatopsis sp. NBRC 101858]|uniref:MFS transporter n=1 Tax=Amycolatopsis sp. NBRC 101858 TaxID=3032200 RepID=UPI0024A43138|nr:MFS transporter [Amycolatopsis sp. NBRC 101858]GLY38871.1 MFS transporter [Amycolatopsis sp. NBRC 101858]